MANLNTKTLNELTIVEEIGENDKVLIESDGDMKKYSITSHIYILDVRSLGWEIHDTALYNGLLQALDTGKTIYIQDDFSYQLILELTYEQHQIFIGNYGVTISPSLGYSSLDLYQPVNFTPTTAATLG